ncbi:uncharacterized protein ACNLHF_012478 isoform 1-T2 [Anomaloglossus baeobatrachus]
MSTRKGIWLLEKVSGYEFLGARLPSKEQVLLVFIYYHKEMKETLSCAAKSTTIKLQEVWKNASIPVMTEENIRTRIQKLYKEYQHLGKEKSRNTDKANKKLQIWKGDLVELFDIARQNVMSMNSVLEDDKAFLMSQRENCMSSSMSGVDKVLASQIRKKKINTEKKEACMMKHYKEITKMNKTVIVEYSSLSSSSHEEDEFSVPPVKKSCAGRRLKHLDHIFTGTWDREQLSIRQASTVFFGL